MRAVLNSPWLRVAGTLAGVALLAHAIDFPKVMASFGHADPRWILGAVGLSALAVLSSVVEWGVLIRTVRSSHPSHASLFTWRRISSQYLQSLFFTQVLPAGVGGDAVRTVEMGRHVGHSRVLASLAGSRMSGMLGMAIWGLAAAVLLRDWLGGGMLIAIAVLAGTIILVWMTALGSDHIGAHRLVGRVSAALGRAVHTFVEAFSAYRRHPHAVAQCLLVGAVGWGVNLFALDFAAKAIGVELSWTVLAVCIPMGLLAALAPFSVNGLGVREGVLVALLVHTGISTAHAGAVSLLVDLQMIPFAVIGAALWMRRRREPAPALVPARI
ncbi:MAG: flippase-like domain-containing protein [Candidatus Dormibacteraeota bacterium]|nr:flippase-like domain-containing protein [Candidatus Dormibacteraeota bacterium]MBV9524559.1 flippase-like domain-containing protein [Candidatus Dormibacteraeota bacterium]